MQPLPTKLYRAEQVRQMDNLAINQYGITGYTLMCRAGQASFDLIQRCWPDAEFMVIYCGAGNNAGDGYVIARLAILSGLNVTVMALKPPEDLKGDALTAFMAYQQQGGKTSKFKNNIHPTACVIVDAMLGTGLDRTVSGDYAEAINVINCTTNPVLAIDIPSGINADSGAVMGCAVKADATIAFIALKQGLYTADAAEYCGSIHFNSLDVPQTLYQQFLVSASLLKRPSIPRRARTAHKGENGHVLIIGGDTGYSGAARLAAEAAARVGAGLVSIASRKAHVALMNINRPELMCHGIENDQQLLPLLDKASVVVIGPGLGKSSWAVALFKTICKLSKPLIIDADGLNLLAGQPQKNQHWVLTPHPGEAARLLQCTSAEIQQDRFEAAIRIQEKYGGTCVLKGSGSLVADGQRISVATNGNPGMATGGMGDVLAGVIAGLCAQGLAVNEAACAGVYLHGEAADLAAEEGERGMLASDLMPYLRKLVNS